MRQQLTEDKLCAYTMNVQKFQNSDQLNPYTSNYTLLISFIKSLPTNKEEKRRSYRFICMYIYLMYLVVLHVSVVTMCFFVVVLRLFFVILCPGLRVNN